MVQKAERFLRDRIYDSVHGTELDEGWTPLRCAVHEKNEKMVKYLLAQDNIDVESPLTASFGQIDFSRGMTILHSAMAWSTPNIVAMLLNAGAKTNVTSGALGNPFNHAIKPGNIKTVRFWMKRFPEYKLALASASNIFTPMCALCYYGSGSADEIAMMADFIARSPEQ